MQDDSERGLHNQKARYIVLIVYIESKEEVNLLHVKHQSLQYEFNVPAYM